jgi:hypothetical protein
VHVLDSITHTRVTMFSVQGRERSTHAVQHPVSRQGLRACNRMRRAMRCHGFRSGREASRRQYREYCQGERQCHGRKLVPALRVASQNRGRAEARSRDPLAGCDRVGAKPSRVSGALSSRCGVASKHEALGTCSALRGTLCRPACSYSRYELRRPSRHPQFWLQRTCVSSCYRL